MKNKVILIRGIPGSGKSFHVEELRKQYDRPLRSKDEHPRFAVVSADSFFMKTRFAYPPGHTPIKIDEYLFDPFKLGQAHARCFYDFASALKTNTKVVVVDNTNIHQWEFKNYLMLANNHGYDVEFHEIRVTTIEELKLCVARNTHKVPMESIVKSAMEFEPMDERLLSVIIVPFQKSLK